MIRRTDTEWAPWTTVKSNDKKRARLEAMRAFLTRFDYEGKDEIVVGRPDPGSCDGASTRSVTRPSAAAGHPSVWTGPVHPSLVRDPPLA
jgi:hypothetical protein